MYHKFSSRTVPFRKEIPDVRVRKMYVMLFSRSVPYRHVECTCTVWYIRQGLRDRISSHSSPCPRRYPTAFAKI